MNRKKLRPLWTCPKCGNRFVTPNLWHSCVRITERQYLRGKTPQAVALYRRFKSLVRSFGPIRVVVSRTRITFMVRVRFAGVARFGRDHIVAGFWLPYRLRSRRFLKVEKLGPRTYLYRFRVESPRDLDREVRGWMRQAYRVGRQEHLK